MSNYKREDVKVVISGTLGITHVADGYADGEFLSIEPDGDGWTETVGSHKRVTRNRIDMPGGVINLKLHPESPTNKVLERLWKTDRGSGTSTFRILARDQRSDVNMALSESAYVKNTPSLKFGNEAQPKEWEIRCMQLEIFHGQQLAA